MFGVGEKLRKTVSSKSRSGTKSPENLPITKSQIHLQNMYYCIKRKLAEFCLKYMLSNENTFLPRISESWLSLLSVRHSVSSILNGVVFDFTGISVVARAEPERNRIRERESSRERKLLGKRCLSWGFPRKNTNFSTTLL